MKKIINSRIFLIIICGIIFTSLGVYGANTYNSNSVLYTTSTGESMSVEDALNDLYENNSKATGPTKEEAASGETYKAIVYLDPTDLTKKCTADNSVSKTETKEGCMKWYVYAEDNDTYTMILDHNTTAKVQWNSSNSSASQGNIATALASDISSWDSSLGARLISADEIATISGNTSFNSATTTYIGWFFLDSNSQTQIAKTQGASKYAWLFDYTSGCTRYGCDIEDNNTYTLYGNTSTGITYGYWTSTPTYNSSPLVWHVSSDLAGDQANFSTFGVRPVITVQKSKIS